MRPQICLRGSISHAVLYRFMSCCAALGLARFVAGVTGFYLAKCWKTTAMASPCTVMSGPHSQRRITVCLWKDEDVAASRYCWAAPMNVALMMFGWP